MCNLSVRVITNTKVQLKRAEEAAREGHELSLGRGTEMWLSE